MALTEHRENLSSRAKRLIPATWQLPNLCYDVHGQPLAQPLPQTRHVADPEQDILQTPSSLSQL